MSNHHATGKIPPQDIDAELDLLGACLLDVDALTAAIEIVSSDDFYRDAHKQIFTVMRSMFDDNETVDLITITDKLKRINKLDVVGGGEYIASLADVIFTKNAGSWAKIIKGHSIRRQIIATGQQMIEDAYSSAQDVDSILVEAEAALLTCTSGQSAAAANMHSVTQRVMDNVRIRQESTGEITGLATGFTDLDRMTSGLQPSDFIVIAGRPSMGKTAFGTNILLNAADKKTPTACFSLEMSSDQLGERILADYGTVAHSGIRKGNLNSKNYNHLIDTATRAATLPIYIDDTAALDITDIKLRARRLHAKHKIGLLVVDYLQLTESKVAKKREEHIAAVSRGLKKIAKELNIPVIALAQLNRGVEQRQDKRPMLSDLRESGAIEQDADVIMFIYRADQYRKADDPNRDGKATIIVAKQRNGPTGEVELDFNGAYARFSNPGETRTIYKKENQKLPWNG